MVLLRRVLGDALRAQRQAQHRTLREVSTEAKVSLGYLSEVERGQKEASSELLSSICDALGVRLSAVLRDASATLSLAEQMQALEPVPAGRGSVGFDLDELDRDLQRGIERDLRSDGEVRARLRDVVAA
jgi:transcriptional regulator with XRE-family HTH domain